MYIIQSFDKDFNNSDYFVLNLIQKHPQIATIIKVLTEGVVFWLSQKNYTYTETAIVHSANIL